MNGNIFTEFLKTNIPDTVEKFIEQNQLKLYFKYEIKIIKLNYLEILEFINLFNI